MGATSLVKVTSPANAAGGVVCARKPPPARIRSISAAEMTATSQSRFLEVVLISISPPGDRRIACVGPSWIMRLMFVSIIMPHGWASRAEARDRAIDKQCSFGSHRSRADRQAALPERLHSNVINQRTALAARWVLSSHGRPATLADRCARICARRERPLRPGRLGALWFALAPLPF